MDVNPQTDPALHSAVSGAARPLDHQPSRGEEQRGETGGVIGFAWFIAKLIVAGLVLRVFIIAPFSIPSESMLPKLWQGDYLIATKWSYGYSNASLPFQASLFDGRILATQPERGDVVIFKHPIDNQDYVKRVIGLPGDTVQMLGGHVLINGEFISKEPVADFEIPIAPNAACIFGERVFVQDASEPRCAYKRFREELPGGVAVDVLDFGLSPGDSTPIKTVPEGHMFVMGDNRDYSRDSRFPALAGDGVGMVPQSKLVGRARFIFWSTDGRAEWVKPWKWFSAARWERIGLSL